MSAYKLFSIQTSALAVTIISLLSASQIHADPITESIENALKFNDKEAKYGQIKVNLRYRYENDDTKTLLKKSVMLPQCVYA